MNSFLNGEMLVAGVAAERLSNSKAPIDYEVGPLVKNRLNTQNAGSGIFAQSPVLVS